MDYSPEENVRRVRHGLAELVAGRSAEFAAKQTDLVVVFRDDAKHFSSTKLLHFQNFFYDHLGFVPEVVRQVPACVKVFFHIGSSASRRNHVALLIQHPDFKLMSEDLSVSHVQFAGKVTYFSTNR